MARKLFDMPVEPIIRHPLAMTLPCAAYGALNRLCYHFWETECRPLPTDDHTLMQLARVHRPTWRHHKPAIMQVIHDVLPALANSYSFRAQGRNQLRIAARNGAAIRTATARAARIQQSTPALPDVSSFHQMGFTPKREPPSERPPAPLERPPRPIRTDTLTRR